MNGKLRFHRPVSVKSNPNFYSTRASSRKTVPATSSKLAQAKALERDACGPGRSRVPPLPQGGRARGKTLLHGPCHDGEPARACRGGHGHKGRWHGRTPRLASHAESQAQGHRPSHRGGRATKAYDTRDRVETLRAIDVAPHAAPNQSPAKTGKRRRSAIDGRTTRHANYGLSQKCLPRRSHASSAGASSTARCARPSTAALPVLVQGSG